MAARKKFPRAHRDKYDRRPYEVRRRQEFEHFERQARNYYGPKPGVRK